MFGYGYELVRLTVGVGGLGAGYTTVGNGWLFGEMRLRDDVKQRDGDHVENFQSDQGRGF